MTKFAVFMGEGAKSATVIHMKKENYTMNLGYITDIYGLIRNIIARNEPNSQDEFDVLDKIFGYKG